MDIQETIVNKVAQSGLTTIDLAQYAPNDEIIVYDIKNNLFHELILKEKDFRDFVKNHDWSQYEGKNLAITCSSDAIVPTWAYMILTNKLTPFAKTINFGTKEEVYRILFSESLGKIDYEKFRDQKVVIKGCGEIYVPESAFVQFTQRLSIVAQSIMYGEPCSTVPVFKRKN